jgi:hypothetical protein
MPRPRRNRPPEVRFAAERDCKRVRIPRLHQERGSCALTYNRRVDERSLLPPQKMGRDTLGARHFHFLGKVQRRRIYTRLAPREKLGEFATTRNLGAGTVYTCGS